MGRKDHRVHFCFRRLTFSTDKRQVEDVRGVCPWKAPQGPAWLNLDTLSSLTRLSVSKDEILFAALLTANEIRQLKRKFLLKDFPIGPVVSTDASNPGDTDLIPGLGTKVLHATQHMFLLKHR